MPVVGGGRWWLLADHLGIVDLHSLVIAEGEIHSLILIGGFDDGVDLDTAGGGEGDFESEETGGEILAHSERNLGVKLKLLIILLQLPCQTR